MKLKVKGKQFDISKMTVVWLLAILLPLAGVAGYFIVKSGGDVIIEGGSVIRHNSQAINAGGEKTGGDNGLEPTDASGNAGKKAADNGTGEGMPENKNEISVYVTGCVKNPGIVVLEKGQLINDAIMKAGGITVEADLSTINLVYELNENTMLYIKPASAKDDNNALSGLKDSSGGKAGSGVILVKDSGGTVLNENSSIKGSKININKATVEELDTLPGIGEATAKDIIVYREKYGNFKNIESIMNVPGIKENKFAKIKDLITVGD